jgi:hypothetical protein
MLHQGNSVGRGFTSACSGARAGRSFFGLCQVGIAHPPTGALAARRSVTRLRYLPLLSRARLEFGTLVTVNSLRYICDGLRLTRTSHLRGCSRRRPSRWTLRLRPRRIAAPRETSTRRSTAGSGHRGRQECPLRGTRTRCRELFGYPQCAVLDMRTASVARAKIP